MRRAVIIATVLSSACNIGESRPTCTCDAGMLCSATGCVPVGGMDRDKPDAGFPKDAALGPIDACHAVVVDDAQTFCTITEALQAATAMSTITLPPGEIYEKVIVDKPVRIIGPGKTEGLLYALQTTATLSLSAPGARVEALSVESTAGPAVRVNADATLDNVTVRGAVGTGIIVDTQATLALDEVRIDRVRAGLGPTTGLLVRDATAILSAGRIINVEGAGIEIHGGTVIAAATDIANNATGIVTDDSTVLRLRGARVRGHSGHGIDAAGGFVLVAASECARNGNVEGDGARFSGSVTASIAASVFAENGGWGLSCGPDVMFDRCEENVFTRNPSGGTNCEPCK